MSKKPSKKAVKAAAAVMGRASRVRKSDAVREAASTMALKRWSKMSPGERSRQMKAVRAHGGGRPRDPERCYCGARNLNSARQRLFDCCKRAGKYPYPAGKTA